MVYRLVASYYLLVSHNILDNLNIFCFVELGATT